MYHSVNTVLQLEKMPDKSINLEANKQKEIKDYDKLIPVVTLIWLADDTLNFKDDYVSYTMANEAVLDFIRNKNLWKEENILKILEQRAKCLEIIDNKTKKLDFYQKNKLICAFQPNIVRNKKYSRYLPWFELAEKTRDKLNQKGWFDEYLKDEIFTEIIKRINTESFEQSDWEYIDNYEKFSEQVKRFEKVFIEEGIDIGKEQGIDIGKEQGIDIGLEKSAINGIKSRFDNEIIYKMTGLTDEQINKLRELVEKVT
jgi:hypothetical protein